MENKLQQLTEKLYNEGLSKGQAEGETIIAQAKQEAAKIIAKAKADAEKTADDAAKAAAELKINTENEVRLASLQAMSSLRQQIERMIVTAAVTPRVNAAWTDGKFVKELILAAVEKFNPTSEEPINIVVPEWMLKEIEASIAEKLNDGIRIVTDSKVKVPFRIAPQNGSYYVSFTDADFDTLFKSYIRPRVSELLFKKSE